MTITASTLDENGRPLIAGTPEYEAFKERLRARNASPLRPVTQWFKGGPDSDDKPIGTDGLKTVRQPGHDDANRDDVLAVLRTCPNCTLVNTASGIPKVGWFNALNASTRNWLRIRSVQRSSRNSERSKFCSESERRMLRPAVPKVN